MNATATVQEKGQKLMKRKRVNRKKNRRENREFPPKVRSISKIMQEIKVQKKGIQCKKFPF